MASSDDLVRGPESPPTIASRSSPSRPLSRETFQAEYQSRHDAVVRTFPELGPAELRVCALTLLGLDASRIASILALDPLTIRKHRRLIRQKLGISGSVHLRAYLNRTVVECGDGRGAVA